MSPDHMHSEEYLLSIIGDALDKLSDRYHETYRIVEQEGCSRHEAGGRLGVASRTVANDLVAARRAIRQATKAEGIAPLDAVVGKRTQRSRPKRQHRRFAPKYAEPVRTTPERSPLTHAP
jgi:hypothetical protein